MRVRASRCEGNKVVCKASLRDGGLETVGDLVCETRGTPKPTWDANPERMAAECTVLPTLRDDKPTEQCMEKSAGTARAGTGWRILDFRVEMARRRLGAAIGTSASVQAKLCIVQLAESGESHQRNNVVFHARFDIHYSLDRIDDFFGTTSHRNPF